MIISSLARLKFSRSDSPRDMSKLWTDLLERFPHESTLWEYYGYFLSAWPQDFESAADAFRQASRYTDNPNERFKLNNNLATALYRGRKFDEAEKEFLALMQRLDKMGIYEQENSWKFSNRSDMTSKETAKSIYSGLSDTYIAKKEIPNALNILEKGLERLPKCFELQRKIALIYTSQKDEGNAIQAYYRYFEILPSKNSLWESIDFLNVPDAVIAFTDLLIGENQFDKARELILKERTLNREMPPPVSAYTALSYKTSLYVAEAKIHLATNNLEEAVERLNKAIEIQPQIYITWDILEQAYTSKGLYREAKQSAQRAIELNPTISVGYKWLSDVCWTLGEKEDAIDASKKYLSLGEEKEALKEYLPLNIIDARFQKNLGAMYFVLGRYEEAIVSLQTGINTEPNDAVSQHILARSLLMLGHREEAIESYKQLIKLNPNIAVAYSSLAFLYAETGDFEKAVEYQKKAIDLADDSAKKEYEKRLEAYKAKKPWRE